MTSPPHNERRRIIFGQLWPAILIALLAFVGCQGSRANLGEAGGEASAESTEVVVRVAPVEKRRIAQTLTALGRCEAPPEKLALLTPLVEGQIAAVLVQQGQSVKTGQAVIELDNALAAADLAEKKIAAEELVAARKLLESVPRDEEQQASKLAIEQAVIAVDRANALVERLRPLRTRGEIPEQQMYEAEETLKQARVQQRAAEAQYNLLLLPPRSEAIAEAQAKIKAADEAVKTAQTKMDYYTIRAPIEGVLNSLSCHPGETIAIGSSIGEILDSRQVIVKAWFPVRSLSLVREGQTVRLRQPGLPATDAGAEPAPAISGHVAFVGSIADPQTGNVEIHVAVENSGRELVIGETLYAEVIAEQASLALAVPVAAIHDEGEGEVVTVVRDGKAAVLHPQFGPSDGGWTTISGIDLKEGEPVIIEGAYNLPDEAPVQVNSTDGNDAGKKG